MRASLRSKVGLRVVVCALVLAAGCVNSPRNGQSVPSRSGQITLYGLVTNANAFVALQMRNFQSGGLRNIAQGVTSGTTVTRDQLGMSWYQYNAPAYLSGGPEFWKRASSVGSQRRVEASVALWNSADGYLATFDTNADACGQANASGGLAGVINNCSSSRSPEASLFVNCGKADQDCCIAYNITSAQRCDAGRLCGSTNRCTVVSGGLNQACNGDGTCNASNLGCISNVCRDTKIEGMLIATLDLEVRTCSDSSLLTQDDFQGPLSVDVGTGGRYFLTSPGNQGGKGQVDTYGLRIQGVRTLRDVKKLDIFIDEDMWCVDRVRLLANGRQVFAKTWPTSAPAYANPLYPYHLEKQIVGIPSAELRTHWTQLSSAPLCTLPTQLSGAALQRSIVNRLGHELRRPQPNAGRSCSNDDACAAALLECRSGTCQPRLTEMDYESGDFGTLRAGNAGRVHFDAQFSGHYEGNSDGYDDADVTMGFAFDLDAACNASRTNMTVAGSNEDLWVEDVEAEDPLLVVADTLSFDAVSDILTFYANIAMSGQQTGLAGAVQALQQAFPVCLNPSFTTTTPPSLSLTLPAGLPNDICIF